MVHRCCICGLSVRVVEAKGLSYHKFPTKEPIRDQWVQAVIPHIDKPESFKVVPRYTRVCSRHFRKKDYCMDAKKRARLNSNAVPSVFPRKNTPFVVPTILPGSPKLGLGNSKILTATPGTQGCPPPQPVASSSSSVTSSSTEAEPAYTIPTKQLKQVEITTDSRANEPTTDDTKFNDLLGKTALLIESASIQDDHLVLTLMDPTAAAQVDVEISNSDDQSHDAVKVDDGGSKRRKRRKWNRTAFARPAKGKRKSLVKTESEQQEGSGDGDNENVTYQQAVTGNGNHDTTETSGVTEASNVLPDLHGTQPTTFDQDLLQSIQAVSLRCVGDVDVTNAINQFHEDDAALHNEVFGFSTTTLVPAFLHHHSSEESLFSNESQHNEQPSTRNDRHQSQSSSQAEADVVTAEEDDSLRFDLVDLRIDPDVVPNIPPPTYLDIDELAHQLNSSLFTDGKLPLFTANNSFSSSGTSGILNLSHDFLESTNTDEESNREITIPDIIEPREIGQSWRKELSPRARGSIKSAAPPRKATPAANEQKRKLKGVTKRPKKDKIVGKFSVERFKNSDKDIEYYTAFKSYRNFEAFFRSLEAYIERICITDVTYGVNNLPQSDDKPTSCSTLGAEEGTSASQKAEQPKKRSCQGRAMSRINELFMTIIRLRRKLPEKVLGHMFYISQPTVSRVVRAWTVLLSKIIDSYPVESSGHSSSSEHSYTNKGLGIPDAFRELFKSELAKSIVVTSLNPKKVKSKSSSTTNSQCLRAKKSKPSTEAAVGGKAKSNSDSSKVRKEEPPSTQVELQCEYIIPNSFEAFV